MKKSEFKQIIKNILKEEDPCMTEYGMKDFNISQETSDPKELYEKVSILLESMYDVLQTIMDSDFGFKEYLIRNEESIEKVSNLMSFVKDELGDIAQEQLEKVKGDLSTKIDEVFDEDLQKEIVDSLNKHVDIPFINEKMEEKGLNFLYDVFEEKIKAAFKKAL